MIADSGSEENCVRDKEVLAAVSETFNKGFQSKTKQARAGGVTLKITAKGSINPEIDEVFVCNSLDGNILSTPKLRNKGYWFIQPPADVSCDHAGFFFDSEGKLSLVCDKNLITDVTQMNSYDTSIQLPDLSTVLSYLSITRLYVIYGLEKQLTVEDTVDFITQSFMLPIDALCFFKCRYG